jgi:hypothetical protein
MNFQGFTFCFNVKDAACWLPIDWFIADGAVNEECSIRFYYEHTLARLKRRSRSTRVTHSAVACDNQRAPLRESLLD